MAPVVAGKGLEAAVYAIEELEETARLALLLRGLPARGLDDAQIRDVVTHFDVEWGLTLLLRWKGKGRQILQIIQIISLAKSCRAGFPIPLVHALLPHQPNQSW